MSEAYPITVCDRCGKRLFPTLGRSLQPVYLEGMGSPAVVHKHPEGYRAVTEQRTLPTITTVVPPAEVIMEQIHRELQTKKPIKGKKRKSAR